MLIAMTVTCLLLIAAIAAAVSLLDTWVLARFSYRMIAEERQLLAAGFVREVEAQETRLRPLQHRSARSMPAPKRRRRTGSAPRSRLGSIQSFG